MSTCKVLTKESVTVEKRVKSRRFYFLTSVEHGKIFVHYQDLIDDGFDPDTCLVGCQMVIDIEFRANDKNRVIKIHEMYDSLGQKISHNEHIRSQAKPIKRKRTMPVGTESQGKVKKIKGNYGFIAKSGCEDLFFVMNCVKTSLLPFLHVGVGVRFEVQACERGVMANITEITPTRVLIDSNVNWGVYLIKVTYPNGNSVLEVRDGKPGSKSKLLDKPKNLLVAKKMIGKGDSLGSVPGSAEPSGS